MMSGLQFVESHRYFALVVRMSEFACVFSVSSQDFFHFYFSGFLAFLRDFPMTGNPPSSYLSLDRLVELGYASWFGFEIFPPGRFVVRRFRLLLEQAAILSFRLKNQTMTSDLSGSSLATRCGFFELTHQ